jgi:hypothetical protein
LCSFVHCFACAIHATRPDQYLSRNSAYGLE